MFKKSKPVVNQAIIFHDIFHHLKNSYVTISASDTDYGNDAVISVSIPSDATGIVECIIGNEYYSSQTISNAGEDAVFTVSGLTVGIKNIVVNYLGNSQYISCNNTAQFTVTASKESLSDEDVQVRDQGNNIIVVVMPEGVTGTVNLKYQDSIIQTSTLNSESYCEFDVTNLLSPGTRSVTIEYLGDQYYSAYTKNETIEVPKYNTEMTVEAQNTTVGNDIPITITILPVGATGTVTLEIDGVQYSVNVNSYGTTTTAISGVLAGNKTILASYSGDSYYISTYASTTVIVSNVNSDCTLTINYLEQGTNTVLSPQYTNTFTPGSPYDQVSPSILDYSLVDQSQSRVAGTITEDTVINVYYTKPLYTLTITYVNGSTNTSIAPTYTGEYYSGEQYSVPSPVIAGYVANRPTVTGNMPEYNFPTQVIYMPTAPGPEPDPDLEPDPL